MKETPKWLAASGALWDLRVAADGAGANLRTFTASVATLDKRIVAKMTGRAGG